VYVCVCIYVCIWRLLILLREPVWPPTKCPSRCTVQPAFSTTFNATSIATKTHADIQAILYRRGWTVRLLRSPDQWRQHSSWRFVLSQSTEYPAAAVVARQTRTVPLVIASTTGLWQPWYLLCSQTGEWGSIFS